MSKGLFAQQYAGMYGSNLEGICLFENGRYVLYGYATMVPGNYHVEKDRIRFEPDNASTTFGVFACENKSLGDSVRMCFKGFERGETFVQLGDKKMQRVFNEGANCFGSPFVYESTVAPTRIALSYQYDGEEVKITNNTEVYTPEKKYNDFVLLYNKPDRYHAPFLGMVTKEEGETVLRVSLTSRLWPRVPDNKDMEELKAAFGGKPQELNELYANRHYKLLEEIEKDEYAYDAVSQQYLTPGTQWNKVVTDYNDVSALRKYVRILPVEKENKQLNEKGLSSIFYTDCGDPEKSYRYKPLEKPAAPHDGPLPTTAVPREIK